MKVTAGLVEEIEQDASANHSAGAVYMLNQQRWGRRTECRTSTQGSSDMHAQQAESLHSQTHVPALDGLRGIAILLVVIYHSVRYGGMQPIATLDQIFFTLGRVGWSGVDLFFVLSGFLITGILYDAKGEDRYFRHFYARRILRIFPLYYGFLCFFFVILPSLILRGEQFSSPWKDQIWYWTYFVNVETAIKSGTSVPALVHFWSLAVEEQFYVVWPWVVFVLSRRTLMHASIGIMAGSLGLRVALRFMAHLPFAAYVLTPSRMDALALGGLLALLAREPDGLTRLVRWARSAVVLSTVFLGIIFIWRHGLAFLDAVVQTIGFSLLAILFGGILVIAVASPPGTVAGRLFAHRFLRFFGRYSYALYVFHHPIMFYMSSFFSVARLPRLAGSQLPGQLAFTTVAASVSLAAALLSWHLYETQFLKLKALFPYDTRTKLG